MVEMSYKELLSRVAQLEQMAEAMQEGVIYFSGPLEVLDMNPAARRILGQNPERLQRCLNSTTPWPIWYDEGGRRSPDRLSPADNPVGRCFASGNPETNTIFRTINPQTGRKIWVATNVTPLFGESETKPTQVIATFNDITERVRLRETRQAHLFLMENMHRWSHDELLEEIARQAAVLTGSVFGLYQLVDEQQQGPGAPIIAKGKSGEPAVDKGPAGFYNEKQQQAWRKCLQQGETIIYNGPGHGGNKSEAGAQRSLFTPVRRGNKVIVALMGVGNKDRPYTEEDAGQLKDFAHLTWEVLEQKRMEIERHESRKKLNALISNLPGMAFSVQPDALRTLQFVSEGCAELTGWTARELLNATVSFVELIHTDDRQSVLRTVKEALAQGRSYEVEYRLQHRLGLERIVLERGTGIKASGSEQVVIEGFAADITEQRQAAKQIEHSHQQLLTILDSIEAQIFVADMQTHAVLFANRKMKELYGQSLTGKLCYQVFQNQEQPCAFCTNDHLLDPNGEPGPVCQWENLSPITNRWYVNYDRAVRWINNKIVRMQVAFDNTDRKESELKLRQAQKMEALGLLAGGVAHDFNNILSVILGYAAMALDELTDSSQRVKRDVLQIQKAGLRARDLVKQILTFCQQTEEHFQPLKLHLIVKEVVKMLRSSFPSTIEIFSEIESSEQAILADPSQMHQILMNLCTNALHAMKDGGALTISLKKKDLEAGLKIPGLRDLPPGPYLELGVRDTGSGIPAAILDKVFDPFFTTKGEGEGTGLGLAVVQGIVTAHKGTVMVESQAGIGTFFTLYFPLVQQIQAGAGAGACEEEAPGGTEHILIIDDEPSVALILQRQLENLGYVTQALTDSSKALELYSRDVKQFDLVVSDMTMPILTGIALARAMLALNPAQAIIICTGFSEIIDKESAKAEGIFDFLEKPVSRPTLARAVRSALDKAKEKATVN